MGSLGQGFRFDLASTLHQVSLSGGEGSRQIMRIFGDVNISSIFHSFTHCIPEGVLFLNLYSIYVLSDPD